MMSKGMGMSIENLGRGWMAVALDGWLFLPGRSKKSEVRFSRRVGKREGRRIFGRKENIQVRALPYEVAGPTM